MLTKQQLKQYELYYNEQSEWKFLDDPVTVRIPYVSEVIDKARLTLWKFTYQELAQWIVDNTTGYNDKDYLLAYARRILGLNHSFIPDRYYAFFRSYWDDVYRAIREGEDLPQKVYDQFLDMDDTEQYHEAVAYRAEQVAIEARRIRWQDAPLDVTIDDLLFEPEHCSLGNGFSERQFSRTWVSGRYISQCSDIPSVFDFGAEIVDTFTVYIGEQPRKIEGAKVTDGIEDSNNFFANFDTLTEAFTFAVQDKLAPRFDFLPLTSDYDVESARMHNPVVRKRRKKLNSVPVFR